MRATKKFVAIMCAVLVCVTVFATMANAASMTLPVLKRGGNNNPNVVSSLQRMLNYTVGAGLSIDGSFGPATEKAVRNFQSKYGLGVDGIVGPVTWNKLFNKCTVRYGNRNDMVKLVQQSINGFSPYDCGASDGSFGPKTKAAVIKCQKYWGISADGIVGPNTWKHFIMNMHYSCP